jgi:hypothetical protein
MGRRGRDVVVVVDGELEMHGLVDFTRERMKLIRRTRTRAAVAAGVSSALWAKIFSRAKDRKAISMHDAHVVARGLGFDDVAQLARSVEEWRNA